MANPSTILSTANAAPLRGYLYGLTLSTAGASVLFTVATGAATDDSFKDILTANSSIQKNFSLSWAVGSGNIGSLDTGTFASGTWYHVFLIKRPDTGVVDVLTSLSATSPTMPTNYTLKRRIGSVFANVSSVMAKFIQTGDEFWWDVPVNDVNVTNPGTLAVLRALSVPPNLKVLAKFNAFIINEAATANGGTSFTDPDTTDTAPTGGVHALGVINLNTANVAFQASCMTNTSRQIRTRATASSTNSGLSVTTYAWVDTRGRI